MVIMRVHICAELKQASTVNRTSMGIYVSIVLLKMECQSLQIQQPVCDMRSQVADWDSRARCSKLTIRRWQIVVWLVHNAFGSMWKDIILTLLEVMSQYLPGGTDENWHFSQDSQTEIWTRVQNMTSGCYLLNCDIWCLDMGGRSF